MAIEFTSLGKLPETKNLLIVDGLNLAFRWKHQRKEFFKVEYKKTVESLAKSYQCGRIVVLGDGGSEYRKTISEDYKAHRREKYADQTEEEKAEFLAFLNEFERGVELLQKDGHGFIKYQGVEADDIAALICAHREELGYEEIWLISSDKDWDLLVDENISRFSTVTRKETTLDNWDEHYDFDPDYYLTFKCLTGDKGDNVPGISGIGPKRASSIIQEYGDVFDIISSLPIQGNYKFIENLNEFGADNLQKNVELMDLSYDIDAQVLGKSEEILETLRNYGN